MIIFPATRALNRNILFIPLKLLNKDGILKQLSATISDNDIEKSRNHLKKLLQRFSDALQIFIHYNNPYRDKPIDVSDLHLMGFLNIKVKNGKQVRKNMQDIRSFYNNATIKFGDKEEKFKDFLSQYFNIDVFFKTVTVPNEPEMKIIQDLFVKVINMRRHILTSAPIPTDDASPDPESLICDSLENYELSQENERRVTATFIKDIKKSLSNFQLALSKVHQNTVTFTHMLSATIFISDAPDLVASKASLFTNIPLTASSLIFVGMNAYSDIMQLRARLERETYQALKFMREFKLIYHENDDIAEVAAAKTKMVTNFNRDYKKAINNLDEFAMEKVINTMRMMKSMTQSIVTSVIPDIDDGNRNGSELKTEEGYYEEFILIDASIKLEDLPVIPGLNITLINDCDTRFLEDVNIRTPLLRLYQFLKQSLAIELENTPDHLKVKPHMMAHIEILDKEILQLATLITDFQTSIADNKYGYERNKQLLQIIDSLREKKSALTLLATEISQETSIEKLYSLDKKLTVLKASFKQIDNAIIACRNNYSQVQIMEKQLYLRYTALAELLAQLNKSFVKLKSECAALDIDKTNRAPRIQTYSENIVRAEKILTNANQTYAKQEFSSDSNQFSELSATLDSVDDEIKKFERIISSINQFLIDEKQMLENAKVGRQKKFVRQSSHGLFAPAATAAPAIPAPAARRNSNTRQG